MKFRVKARGNSAQTFFSSRTTFTTVESQICGLQFNDDLCKFVRAVFGY